MIPRKLTDCVLSALADTPVVFITGPRQSGKSTLARWVADGPHPARYLSLDDLSTLSAAESDPEGFVAGLEGPAVLDEVQRAPGLFLAIKAAVDRERQPGRFLLTGSANALMLPALSQALVGRMEVLTLWPLSQAEIEQQGGEGLLGSLFGKGVPKPAPSGGREEAVRRALVGGFPEVLSRPSWERRSAWWDSYLATILHRDVRDLAQVEALTELPRLMALIAARSTGLLNVSELSRSSGIPNSTLKRYLALLEATFLVRSVPAWSGNLSKRLVKSPKLMLTDTGLMGRLMGIGPEWDAPDPGWVGPLLENFAVMELCKQASWSGRKLAFLHFRTGAGREVDLVLEDGRGHLVGVEVKASATVRSEDFAGLRTLAEDTGERFQRGVVLHGGTDTTPFGERLYAVPMSALWQ